MEESMTSLQTRDQEFFTVQDLAQLLKVNIKTIYRMVDRGDIHYYEVGSRTKRFHWDDVNSYLQSRRR